MEEIWESEHFGDCFYESIEIESIGNRIFRYLQREDWFKVGNNTQGNEYWGK